MAISASPCSASPRRSALGGVVRDSEGTPQMGAVVELLSPGSAAPVQTVVTGLDGHYLFQGLAQGIYRLHADATLFRPVSTRGVHLASGARAVLNLTLIGLYDTASWLPAQPRHSATEDDWMWTLRSASSRPMLRALPVGRVPGGEIPQRPSRHVAAALRTGSGGFGRTGQQQMVALGYVAPETGGSGSLEVAYTAASWGNQSAPAIRSAASVERNISPWSRMQAAASYESDPSVAAPGSEMGFSLLRLASAQEMNFGELAHVEVGDLIESRGGAGRAVSSHPFGRLNVPLPGRWSLGYAFATDRALQRAEDLDRIAHVSAGDPTARQLPRIERGHHQELSLAHRTASRELVLRYYRDVLDQTPILGVLTGPDLPEALDGALKQSLLVDRANSTFRAEAAGYQAGGTSLLLRQQLPNGVWVEFTCNNGEALALVAPSRLAGSRESSRLAPLRGSSAGLAIHASAPRTGTAAEIAYRWQPAHLISQVDPFATAEMPVALSVSVRQRLRSGRGLPPGGYLAVAATNLLQTGGEVLVVKGVREGTLIQELPTLQASIGFSF